MSPPRSWFWCDGYATAREWVSAYGAGPFRLCAWDWLGRRWSRRVDGTKPSALERALSIADAVERRYLVWPPEAEVTWSPITTGDDWGIEQRTDFHVGVTDEALAAAAAFSEEHLS